VWPRRLICTVTPDKTWTAAMQFAAAEDSARPRTSLPLLTKLTAPDFVSSLGLLPPTPTLEASEIDGGNLNFAFRVFDSASGASVFVKQTPGYVKVLGPGAKLSDQRLVTERRAYREWADCFGDAVAVACLPQIVHFDAERMILAMEYLGTYTLLHERLTAGQVDAGVAWALGDFMGTAHAATHSSQLPAERVATLKAAFANKELRGLQLEYVFTKPFQEAAAAAPLREDASFVAEVESLKAAYRADGPQDNLSLCHGDLHAGSVMVDATKLGAVKVIDPEFAVYGPPGLDVGCLMSGYVLAAILAWATGAPTDKVRAMRDAISDVWEAYRTAALARSLPEPLLERIAAEAAGFAGCEVARTSLGFAGVRGLSIENESQKAAAEAAALRWAVRCIKGRDGGVPMMLEAIDESIGSSAPP